MKYTQYLKYRGTTKTIGLRKILFCSLFLFKLTLTFYLLFEHQALSYFHGIIYPDALKVTLPFDCSPFVPLRSHSCIVNLICHFAAKSLTFVWSFFNSQQSTLIPILNTTQGSHYSTSKRRFSEPLDCISC